MVSQYTSLVRLFYKVLDNFFIYMYSYCFEMKSKKSNGNKNTNVKESQMTKKLCT